jgi:DNA uptake protein ComE-like DNA-binding protein
MPQMPRPEPPVQTAPNRDVAERLLEAASLLEQQQANPFRTRAYRLAADTLSTLGVSVADIIDRAGLEGLEALPHVGSGIARAIYEIVQTGRWAQLERLRGALEPGALFRAVPGIGPALAERIHDHLHIDTLEGLEVAATDGSLESVPGIGARRSAAIRASLSAMLGRVRRGAADRGREPPVATLLAIDREYRERAASGRLPTIAPRRFNPRHESWLPVWHTRSGDWHFTVLFSNTARAHDLDRTRDWVVVFFYDSDHRERQRTVVTEHRGRLAGRRVVRGRENECLVDYESEPTPS